MSDEVVYGRTPLGQQVYDFWKLTPAYLARKYKMPISRARDLQKAARQYLGRPRKPRSQDHE